MGNLDFSKLIGIVVVFLVVALLFGGKLIDWIKHKDDLHLELTNFAYTKRSYDAMETEEKTDILKEISSNCVRKHHIDGLDCTNTAYWFADALEERGVDADLAIEWMDTCNQSCQTGKFTPSMLNVGETSTSRKTNQSSEKSEGTKWFWER